MPQMDGIETIQQMRGISEKELPIIVLTAYDYTEIADKASKAGVSKFISKPLFQSTLFDLLANLSGTQSSKETKKKNKIDFKGARVLLAEDNEMNMEIAETLLQSSGIAVDCVLNGKEAVEKFETSPSGTYMAILMDVHMPEMDGHEAARTIRDSSHPEAKSIPIIAMTADAFAEDVAASGASGMNDHITKPIDVSVLFSTLEKYIPV